MKRQLYAVSNSAIIFLVSLAILSGCTAQSITLTPTLLPTNTQLPPSSTPTSTPVPPSPTPTPRPFADLNEWDLLIFSDSSN